MPVEGNGVDVFAPEIELNPTGLDFGAVTGQTRELSLQIRNRGPALLKVSSLRADNPALTLPSGAAAFALEAGEERNLPVSFKPSAAGAASSTLSVGSDDPGRATVNITLRGTGSGPA